MFPARTHTDCDCAARSLSPLAPALHRARDQPLAFLHASILSHISDSAAFIGTSRRSACRWNWIAYPRVLHPIAVNNAKTDQGTRPRGGGAGVHLVRWAPPTSLGPTVL